MSGGGRFPVGSMPAAGSAFDNGFDTRETVFEVVDGSKDRIAPQEPVSRSCGGASLT